MSAAVMMQPFVETSPRFRANIAIVLFLMTILTGGAAAFVRWRLVVPGDAISTATNILAHAPLFQMLLAADLIAISCYVAMTLLVYELFKPVNKGLSLLAASFSVMSSAIVAFASIFHIAALVVLRGAQYLKILSVQPLPALALACLKLRAQAYDVSLIFFGLSCVLIGYLIFRSSFHRVGSLTPQLTVALLVLLALPALAATDAELIAAGRAAIDRGDVDQAIAQLEKAVAVNPNNSQAHYYLGLAYGRKAQKAGIFGGMSQVGKARDEWLRAVELNPNSVDARLRLIEFYIAAPGIAGGSEEKAIEQAAEMKKRDALDGHRAYAHIYAMQKNLDLAAKEMVEAVREQPKSAKAHYLLGNVLLNQRDWKGSLHEYEMALSLDAAYMAAYFRMGQHAAQSESNYARGEEALRKYLQYKPADDEPGLSRAWYWLGMIQEKQGKTAEARQSYTNSLKIVPDSKDVSEALKRVS
jgi:tetratricopeptide (TPR) repeat protein